MANSVVLARPPRPKRVSSATPTRIARHSAGGGRPAKRLRAVEVVAMVAGGVGEGGGGERSPGLKGRGGMVRDGQCIGRPV